MSDFRTVPIERVIIRDNASRQSKKIGPLDKETIELAETIKEKGLLNPITVHEEINQLTKDSLFILKAGERRLKACLYLKHKEIAVHVIKQESEIDSIFTNLIENEARLSMTNADAAIAYSNLQEKLIEKGMTKRQATYTIANELKKNPQTVETLIRIRNRLIPELFRAFEGVGGIPLTIQEAASYAGLPPDEQRLEWEAWNSVGGRRRENFDIRRPYIPVKHQPIGKLLQIRRTLIQKRDVVFYWRDGVLVDNESLTRLINWFLSTRDESPFREE